MTTERTPQDVLRELRGAISAAVRTKKPPRRHWDEGWQSGWNSGLNFVNTYLIPKAIAEAPDSPQPPSGTRLVLVAENLLEQWGSRTERGERITAEWGEPDEHGWYEPTFTSHTDDVLGELDAAWKEAEGALPEGWCALSVYHYDDGDGVDHTPNTYGAKALDPDPHPPPVMRAPKETYGYGSTPTAALQALAERLRR